MGQYQKFIVALLSATLVAVHSILNRNGPLTSADWLTIADAVGGALLVYLVPNTPPTTPITFPPPSAKTTVLPN